MSMWEADQGPIPSWRLRSMEDVPSDRLPMVLEGLVPYHTSTREKKSQGRGGGPTKRPAAQESSKANAA